MAAYAYVWLFVDYNGTLARIDPATNKVTTFHAGDAGVSLVAANGSLWAAEPDGSDLLQISPAGKVLRKIPVANRPRFESAGEGAIWVLGQADGSLSRVDPVSGKLTATISLEVPGQGGCVGSGGGFVWVTMPGTPFIKVDPATNTVVAEYKGGGGDCISYAAGSVWLSNNASGTVWRLRP